MSKVFITDYIKYPNVEKNILGPYLSAKLTNKVEVLLVWNKIIDKAFIDSLPKLRAIIRYGAGYDNIDINYATKRKIFVCNVPDYGIDEVSDTALAMILNISRGITEYNNFMQSNLYMNWEGKYIQKIARNSNITLGVIGAGRIGSSVILKANYLKYNTVFYDPYKEKGYEKILSSIRMESIKELLKVSDIISFHVPLTNETKGMVNKEFISQLKDGASIVNTSRGKVISNLDIIYDSLKSKKLSNIAFDVLPKEPPSESKLSKAWLMRESWIVGRVIINPHSAFYSKQSFREMREKASLNALRVLAKMKPFHIVNKI